MRYIKKFEGFDFSQTIPMTSENFLTNYYHCDACNALWKEFNEVVSSCKFCNSDEIEDLSEDEWYDTVKGRLDEDEIRELDEERLRSEDSFIDLSDDDDLYEDEN
jgi:hypothetical protein